VPNPQVTGFECGIKKIEDRAPIFATQGYKGALALRRQPYRPSSIGVAQLWSRGCPPPRPGPKSEVVLAWFLLYSARQHWILKQGSEPRLTFCHKVSLCFGVRFGYFTAGTFRYKKWMKRLLRLLTCSTYLKRSLQAAGEHTQTLYTLPCRSPPPMTMMTRGRQIRPPCNTTRRLTHTSAHMRAWPKPSQSTPI
jgi:hypothetical protein